MGHNNSAVATDVCAIVRQLVWRRRSVCAVALIQIVQGAAVAERTAVACEELVWVVAEARVPVRLLLLALVRAGRRQAQRVVAWWEWDVIEADHRQEADGRGGWRGAEVALALDCARRAAHSCRSKRH